MLRKILMTIGRRDCDGRLGLRSRPSLAQGAPGRLRAAGSDLHLDGLLHRRQWRRRVPRTQQQRLQQRRTSSAAPCPSSATTTTTITAAALVGGQAGVNWQISQFVLGIEGDGDAVLGNNRNSNFPGASGGSSTGFLGTVRGRAGIAFDRFLVYGTGGVAFGSNNMPNTVVAAVPGVSRRGVSSATSPRTATTTAASATPLARASNTPSSTIGASRSNISTPISAATTAPTILARHRRGFTVNNRETNHIVRAGLNYRFNWGWCSPAARSSPATDRD